MVSTRTVFLIAFEKAETYVGKYTYECAWIISASDPRRALTNEGDGTYPEKTLGILKTLKRLASIPSTKS